MDTNVSVAIIAVGSSMVSGMFGMWINASGKRIDDLIGRFEDLRGDFKDLRIEVKDLRSELGAFKDVVKGKFRDLDLELAKLMDRPWR